MKRERRDHNICFECVNEFIIVPVERIECILDDKKAAKRLYIPREELLPDGYVEYLERVLNINRHLPQFSYEYIGESPIGEPGILKIMVTQLKSMKIDDKYCFEAIEFVRCGKKLTGLRLLLNTEEKGII